MSVIDTQIDVLLTCVNNIATLLNLHQSFSVYFFCQHKSILSKLKHDCLKVQSHYGFEKTTLFGPQNVTFLLPTVIDY